MRNALFGLGLILIGSGLYWILSSQLITSFTVLMPYTFGPRSLGTTGILTLGIITSAIGLSLISNDLKQLSDLFNRRDGWIFTLPIIFASLDISLSIAGPATGRVIELNPFIASAVLSGTLAIFSFYISYIAMSEGLALMIINIGRSLFGTNGSSMFLAFAITCGIAAFGPLTNILILLTGPVIGLYLCGAFCSSVVSTAIFLHFRKTGLNLQRDKVF
jgi:hypothetical protein